MEVYFAYNNTNGKAYVGMTKNGVRRRFKKHFNDARKGSNTHFHRAIRKYGEASFTVMTVWKGDSADEMQQVEKNYISGMKTMDPDRGYNMTEGGDGGATTTGRHFTMSAETRKKLSEVKKGKPGHKWTEEQRKNHIEARTGKPGPKASPETKKKLSEARQGRQPALGKRWKLSEETKKRQSAAAKGRPGDHRPNPKKGQPGNQHSLGKRWTLSEETRKRQSEASKRSHAARKAAKQLNA